MFYIFNTHNDKITLTTVKVLIDICIKVLFIIGKAASKVLRLCYMVTCLDRSDKLNSSVLFELQKGLSSVLFESSIYSIYS